MSEDVRPFSGLPLRDAVLACLERSEETSLSTREITDLLRKGGFDVSAEDNHTRVRHMLSELYRERKIGWLLRDNNRWAIPSRVAEADLELRQTS